MMEMQYDTGRKISRPSSIGKRATTDPDTPLSHHGDTPSIFTLSDTPTPAFAEVDSELRANRWNNIDDYLERIN
jgi:hypothetical protein